MEDLVCKDKRTSLVAMDPSKAGQKFPSEEFGEFSVIFFIPLFDRSFSIS
jgi:hypothetical protein